MRSTRTKAGPESRRKPERSSLLPNFVVIGTTKGGTTSLYEYLRSHPDIYLPAKKELRFFTVEDNWRLGTAWYEGHFEGVDHETAVGEVSPCYTLYPALDGVPERMAGLIPEARLIYLVRHPIQRMRSHYIERVAHGGERRPLAETVWEDPRYVFGSRYALQIERFLEYYPREQLLVLASEALREDREESLARIFRFLGVDPGWRHPVMRQEFHATRDKTIRRRVLGRIPASKLYQRIRPFVSGTGYGRRIFWRRITATDFSLPPDDETRLRDAVAEDVAELYAYVEGPFDGWGIA